MSNIKILGESLENAEILKYIHYKIDDLRLSINSKDDLNKQIIEVEKYFGGEIFKNIEVKKKKVNMVTGILALPILFYCIALFASRYLHNFGINIDVAEMNQILFGNAIKYLWGIILYAVVFFSSIVYFYKLNNDSKVVIEAIVEKLSKQ